MFRIPKKLACVSSFDIEGVSEDRDWLGSGQLGDPLVVVGGLVGNPFERDEPDQSGHGQDGGIHVVSEEKHLVRWWRSSSN